MADKKIPIYLKEIYGDFYNNKKLWEWADKQWLRNLLSLGNNRRLTETSLKEIAQGDKVLQLGATFGEQMDRVAMRISRYGQYDVLDVSNIQIRRCQQKYGKLYTQMNFIQQNANTPVKGDYDVVLLYMLLHEVPHIQKAKILKAALDSAREGGKVVIIDYHEPWKWHPLKYFVRMFNRLYQPFAEILWDREIPTFIKNKTPYSFRRSLFFGGMYQKVVIEKKYTDKPQKPMPAYNPWN